jgi:hypothetical protein
VMEKEVLSLIAVTTRQTSRRTASLLGGTKIVKNVEGSPTPKHGRFAKINNNKKVDLKNKIFFMFNNFDRHLPK